MNQLHEDGFTLLLAAICRQAVEDYRDGYTNANRPDAGEFLTSAGLLSPDGTLDIRFGAPKPNRTHTAPAQYVAA